MDRLLEIFFLPPMAIARCGSSPTPADSFKWRADSLVHDAPTTVIEPAVSLRVADDGSVTPTLPERVVLRDGGDNGPIRPVAPFFELWGLFQSAAAGGVYEVALSAALLAERGLSAGDFWYEVTAANRKVQRRTGNASDSVVAREVINGADHQRRGLRGFSPHTSGQQPLVFEHRPIPFGQFQVIRPRRGKSEVAGETVDCDRLRVRFTPPSGLTYGPPTASTGPAQATPPGVYEAPATQWGRIHEIVAPERRILNGESEWTRYIMMNGSHEDPAPQDGYDGATVGDNRAWGCIDDSSDGVIQVTATIDGRLYRALARFFVGPPDFAPDRRPVYSIADDLADRELPTVDVESGSFGEAAAEITDLFQRAFDHASLFNLDASRARALQENNVRIANAGLQLPAGVEPKLQDSSMTRLDEPYVDKLPVLVPQKQPLRFSEATGSDPLPYTEPVNHIHQQLKNTAVLLNFIERRPELIKKIVRPPYARVPDWNPLPTADPNPSKRDPRVFRDQLHDMRMPPYLRDANLQPLSLSHRQYCELMAVVDSVAARKSEAQDLGPKSQASAEDVRRRIFPRNLTAHAASAARNVVGNPATARLESAVGNCFPGLEFDVRELDRRFFPGLVFQFVQKPRPEYRLPNVKGDQEGAHLLYADWFFDSMLPETSTDERVQELYLALKRSDGGAFMGGRWYLDWIEQGGVRLSTQDTSGVLYDGYKVWRMVRCLVPDLLLSIGIVNRDDPSDKRQFNSYRRRYVNDAGVIDEAFRPGELTESMCNPWSHDFRDCACHYWATNHPDVVMQRAAGETHDDGRPLDPVASFVLVNWNRRRGVSSEVPAFHTITKNRPFELDHYEINQEWEKLPFVLEGREIGADYAPPVLGKHEKYPTDVAMLFDLRTSLGPMELALAMQYLYALFSLRHPDEVLDEEHLRWPALRDDLKSVRQFLLMIAAAEMTHLRWVNQLLWELDSTNYEPVVDWANELRVLRKSGDPYETRLEELTPERLDDFIEIERPSGKLDAAYGKCVATLAGRPQRDLAIKIDGEGIDHYERFVNVKRILAAYGGRDGRYPYLRGIQVVENEETFAVVQIFDGIRGRIVQAYRAESLGQAAEAQTHIAAARALMMTFHDEAEFLARAKRWGIPLLNGTHYRQQGA